MPMLSSKYTIIGSIIVCVACTWFGYYQGSKHVQILWNQDKLEQAQYIKYFENTHHLISNQEYDLKPLHDSPITIEL